MKKEKIDAKENIIKDYEFKSINPEKKPLTIEKLRSFKGLENLSDEEAHETLFAIEALCAILVEATSKGDSNL